MPYFSIVCSSIQAIESQKMDRSNTHISIYDCRSSPQVLMTVPENLGVTVSNLIRFISVLQMFRLRVNSLVHQSAGDQCECAPLRWFAHSSAVHL